MKRILQLGLIWLLFLSIKVYAQEKTISGKVTSQEDGSPLPGVTVAVKGTTVGTVSDNEGKYNLAVPANAQTLSFSFIGMTTQEIEIGSRSVIEISLVPDIKQLSEVVVTAVGIERSAKSLGYSIEKVDSRKVQQVSEPDALRALQGKVAGVNIGASSGLAGSATRITIRGNHSFLGNNQPLFVVDGIPFNNDQNGANASGNNQLSAGGAYSSRIADLDPNNIESMTVLKGGAAAALYGVRAANGVILITTKSGSNRKSKKGLEVAFSSSLSLEKVANLPDYQNKYGTGTNFNYAAANGSWGPAFGTLDSIPYWPTYQQAFPELYGPGKLQAYRAYPDNVKDFFRTGKVWDNSITVSGGVGNTSLTAVVSQMKQDGFVPNSSFERTNLSLGGHTLLENKLTIGGNFSFINTAQFGPSGGANNSVGNATLFGRLLYPGRNWDITGLPFENPRDRSNLFMVGTGQSNNPYWSAKYDGIKSDVNRIRTSVYAGYDIFKWLNVNYKIGVDNYTQRSQEWYRPGSRGANGLGQITDDDITYTEIESNLIFTATADLTEDFNLKAIVGHNVNQRTSDEQLFQGTGMVNFDIVDIDNTNDVIPLGGTYFRRRLYGVFADVSLGYKDFLYLNLVGRNDWSSTLPTSNRSFFYPGASLSFVFTDAFAIKSDILSFGKLRAGIAKVGNDAPVYSLKPIYQLNPSFPLNGQVEAAFPFLKVPAATLENTTYDPKLTPEFTTEIEFGTNLQFFNNRIGLDVAVYDRRTTNQIAPVSLPISTGFSQLYTNFGVMSNKGIEITLDVTPISLSNGFSWNVAGNFTHNKNVVKELKDGIEEIVLLPTFAGSATSVLRPGEEYGLIRGSVSARDDEGNLLINPANGELIPDPNPAIIGNPNPNFILGVTSTFRFKGFALSGVLDYKDGGDLYSVTNNTYLGRGVTTDTEDRERNAVIQGVLGDVNTAEPLRDENGEKIWNTRQIEVNNIYFGQTFAVNGDDEWSVWDATVVRLREVSLSYTLPPNLLSKTPFGSASLTLTGRNLWYNAPNFPKGSNYDPETNTFGTSNAQGLEFASSPSAKRYGVSLRVTF